MHFLNPLHGGKHAARDRHSDRTFVYSGANLISATNPENGTVNYTYNADHTLATKIDAKGQKVAYTYDQAKRVTLIQRYPNGSLENICQRTTLTTTATP